MAELIRRPELDYDYLAALDTSRPELPHAVKEQVNIRIKYDGYIKRQMQQVQQFKRAEEKRLPPDMDYAGLKGLRIEAAQKLSAIRPANLGQAARITGVSPADISVLMLYLKK